jgi:hypothetical protein
MQETEIVEEKGLLSVGDTDEGFEERSEHDDVIVLEKQDNEFKQKFEKPDNIPIEFWDEEKGTYNHNEILKALEEEKKKALSLRQKLSKGFHNVPETPDHYEIEGIPEDSGVNDEQINEFKKIAHKNGLTQEQFNSLLKDFSETFQPDENDTKAMSEEFATKIYQEEMAKLGNDAQNYINTIRGWGKSLVKTGALTQEDYKTLTGMAVTANEVKLLDKLRQVSGYIRSVPSFEGDSDSGDLKAEADRLMSHPDYGRDPVMQRKVQQIYQKLYD